MYSLTTYLWLTVLSWGQAQQLNSGIRQRHPDVGLDAKQLIVKYGYPLEVHTVLTEDGYILELHRIPHGASNNDSSTQKRVPVIIMPGLLGSSADFVNMGPKSSLGFFVADHGFDVWLINYRGTIWSRKHVKFNPDVDKKTYWAFSFDQIAAYDLKSCIDYVLSMAKQESLYYIGYSQGTTTYFAFAADNPDYAKKIRLSSLLTPVAYGAHIKSPIIQFVGKTHRQIKKLADQHQTYELLPHSYFFTFVGQLFCNDAALTQLFCASFLYYVAGYSTSLNKTMIPVITSNSPAGSSILQLVHFGQIVEAGKFQKYDYGKEENKIKYGQPTPPQYNLANITTSVALFYGNRDLLCAEKDVEGLAAELPNVVLKKLVAGYNHLDFMWGVDASKRVFSDIVKLMRLY